MYVPKVSYSARREVRPGGDRQRVLDTARTRASAAVLVRALKLFPVEGTPLVTVGSGVRLLRIFSCVPEMLDASAPHPTDRHCQAQSNTPGFVHSCNRAKEA